MNTQNFQNLIQSVTGRELIIKTTDIDILNGGEYIVYRKLPLTGITVSFKWKAALTDEKLLRSFITAFCSKYREPNPANYNHVYGGKQYWWNDKTPEQKEHAYFHHASNMYSKQDLLKQVESNFNNESIQDALIRYGFYPTEYGIGIFCFWMTEYVQMAINKMAKYLNDKSIPFSNEFSDARWVYRFKLNLTKESHNNLLNQFN